MSDDSKKTAEKEMKAAIREQKKEKKGGEKQEQIAELTNDLKRVQAEFENYKKRTEKENSRLCDFHKAQLVKKLLAILDSFEMALKSTDNHREFVKGVELIYSQLYTMLKDEGLQHIEAEGRRLDPYLHEVMLSEKSDKDDDIILEELQKGYKFKELILRHSKVKVAKK
jgi:molecular chaperone GrpE